MPLPTNNSRPAIPYNPAQVLPHHNRYAALGNTPPTAQQLDGDLNRIIDLLNSLAHAINTTAAGVFPGADNPLNANKIPTTDGSGNVSWTHVTPSNLTDNAVQTRHIVDVAVTASKIQVQAVGTNQVANNAITTPKVADNAIETAKVLDKAITVAKVGSLNAAAGDVMTADGVGGAGFLANKGRILQIVSYEDRAFVRNEYDAEASPANLMSFKTAPFVVRITPKKSQSKILIFYSINVGAAAGQRTAITFCKNNYPFKTGQDDPSLRAVRGAPWMAARDDPSLKGVTHSILSATGQNQPNGQNGCYNFSSLFMDTGTLNTQIVYEIKKASPYTSINAGYHGGGSTTISVMHAIEIDI